MRISAWHVPQESHDRSKAQYEDCCIEPWEALQFEMEQCRTLTLVTSIELLQSLSKRDSSESRPGAPCSLICSCHILWHGPMPSINACKTLRLGLQDTESVPLLSVQPLYFFCDLVYETCLIDGLPCA